MLSQKDIIGLETLNYFQEQEKREYEAMVEANRLYMKPKEEKYEEFKNAMLQYGDFSEEELKEMFEAEMLVENDL